MVQIGHPAIVLFHSEMVLERMSTCKSVLTQLVYCPIVCVPRKRNMQPKQIVLSGLGSGTVNI